MADTIGNGQRLGLWTRVVIAYRAMVGAWRMTRTRSAAVVRFDTGCGTFWNFVAPHISAEVWQTIEKVGPKNYRITDERSTVIVAYAPQGPVVWTAED